MRAISTNKNRDNNMTMNMNNSDIDDIGPPIGEAIQKPFPSNCPRYVSGGLEWVQLIDIESNKYFWFSESTNVSLWEKPSRRRAYYNEEEGDETSNYSVRYSF